MNVSHPSSHQAHYAGVGAESSLTIYHEFRSGQNYTPLCLFVILLGHVYEQFYFTMSVASSYYCMGHGRVDWPLPLSRVQFWHTFIFCFCFASLLFAYFMHGSVRKVQWPCLMSSNLCTLSCPVYVFHLSCYAHYAWVTAKSSLTTASWVGIFTHFYVQYLFFMSC